MRDNASQLGNNSKFRIIATTSAFSSLFAYAAVLTITPACTKEIERTYNVPHTMLAFMMLIMMAGFLTAVIGAGRYADRAGKLRPILLGDILLGLGLIMFAIDNKLPLAFISFALMGLGGGFSEATSMALVTDLYHGSRRTAMLNVSQAVFGVGAVASPIVISVFLSLGMNWRLGYAGVAGIAFLSAVFTYLALLKNGEVIRPATHRDSGKKIYRDTYVIWLCIGILLYVGGECGQANWLGAFFEERLNSSAALAASSPAYFWGGISCGRVLGAFLSRFLSEFALVRISILIAALFQVFLLIQNSPISGLVYTFALGLCLGPIFPTIVSIAGGIYPTMSGTITGIIVAAGALGGAIFPPAIGIIADRTGLQAALVICFIVLIIEFLIFVRMKAKI